MTERENLQSLLPSGLDSESITETLPTDKLLSRDLLSSSGMPVNPKLVEEARMNMRHLLHNNRNHHNEETPSSTTSSQTTVPFSQLQPVSGSPAQLATLLPCFVSLKNAIEKELDSNISRLMALNPSRREAIAYYLDRLAGHGSAPSAMNSNSDAAGGLRRWVEGPRSPAQNLALQIYFEEIALITLGHALLLKVWNDREHRPLSRTDLKDLNWALNTAIKKQIPHDRENWHIARQNIYSWYKPNEKIQNEIWETTSSWHIHNEGPGFLPWLFRPARAYRCENIAPQGYDSRFYQAITRHLAGFGLNLSKAPGPIKRNWLFFSPTLRDGALTQSTPSTVTWIGTETSAFNLMTAELMELWTKPTTPPLWSMGTGLDAHASDQLSLGTGYSNPKPSLISRIAEMEACDVAFILEERSTKLSGKNAEAHRLRELLEGLRFFKKLRSAGTTLGDLQACVALSKLRPGGLLWWAREEPLSEADGREMLNFMLERAKLSCEWDFSQLEHSLPTTKPAFPRYLYLFIRETGVESRLTHRPTRITAQGQIRSHVEIPFMLEEAFAAFHTSPEGSESRGQWKLHLQKSPTPQREWSERWPDPACQATLRHLENIRENSVPLAGVATIRPLGDCSSTKENAKSLHQWLEGFKDLKGIWIYSEQNTDGRKLRAIPVYECPTQDHLMTSNHGPSFLMRVPDEKWLAPLAQFLESQTVQTWLDYHAERKGDRWILSEQLVKCIPVSKSLLAQLGYDFGSEVPFSSSIQENEEIHLVSALLENPTQARVKAHSLSLQAQAAIFTQASLEIEKLRIGHGSFLSLITPDGNIRWGELLKMIPQAECVTVPLHPKIRIMGNLPLHLAIGRFERMKAPSPGILFTTEAGFHLCVTSESPMLLDIIWDQLEGLSSPTWSELVTYLRLPRRIELAEETASELLRVHGEQSQRMREMNELVSSCVLF